MVEVVEDLEELEAFLRRDPLLNLYALGDLDPFFQPWCTFYGWRGRHGLEAVALLYQGQALPALLALGPPPLDRLLEALAPSLPRRLYAHLSPGLERSLEARYEVEHRGRFARMGLTRPERVLSLGATADRLAPEDLPEVVALYEAAYPEHWFDPRMLETGRYFGLRRQGELTAVAGVHVFSRSFGAAALGNITTHPRWRRQGLGRRVTAALCADLLEDIDVIGLNVRQDNHGATQLYASLGFEVIAPYGEVLAATRDVATL